MSVAIGGAWALFAALWASEALPTPGLLGAPADIALVLVIVWSYVRRPEEAIAIAVVGGFATDLLSSQPLGVSVLALLPAALAGGFREARVLDTDWVSTMAVTLVATIVYHLILLTLLTMAGTAPPIGEAMREVALPAALVNALLAPLFYVAIWLGSLDLRASRRQLRAG